MTNLTGMAPSQDGSGQARALRSRRLRRLARAVRRPRSLADHPRGVESRRRAGGGSWRSPCPGHSRPRVPSVRGSQRRFTCTSRTMKPATLSQPARLSTAGPSETTRTSCRSSSTSPQAAVCWRSTCPATVRASRRPIFGFADSAEDRSRARGGWCGPRTGFWSVGRASAADWRWRSVCPSVADAGAVLLDPVILFPEPVRQQASRLVAALEVGELGAGA